MAEQPLLIFVSSSINEFRTERERLEQRIRKIPILRTWIFEYTPASPDTVEQAYLERVRDCDMFVGILGEEIRPAVRAEFDLATALGKRRLIFVNEGVSESVKQYAKDLPNAPKFDSFQSQTDLISRIINAILDELIRGYRRFGLSIRGRNLLKDFPKVPPISEEIPPKPFSDLFGRQEPLQALLDRLNTLRSLPIVLHGFGGVGKTALAWEIARIICEQRQVAGILWETAKRQQFVGTQLLPVIPSTENLTTIVANLLRKAGTPAVADEPLSQQLEKLRQILSNEILLVVIDNVETAEESEQLINTLANVIGHSKMLITSRKAIELSNYTTYRLTGLQVEASIKLLRGEANNRQAEELLLSADKTLARIHGAVKGLPLALKHVVGRVANGLSIEQALARIERVNDEEALYKYLFVDTWHMLTNAAREILSLAAAFPDDIDEVLLRRTANRSERAFEDAIITLVRLNLAEIVLHRSHRFVVLHPLTRLYAREMMAKT